MISSMFGNTVLLLASSKRNRTHHLPCPSIITLIDLFNEIIDKEKVNSKQMRQTYDQQYHYGLCFPLTSDDQRRDTLVCA